MKKILIAIVCILGLTWGIANAQTMNVSTNSRDLQELRHQQELIHQQEVRHQQELIRQQELLREQRNQTGISTTSRLTGTSANLTSAAQGKTTKVPEPVTMILLGLGFLGLAGIKRKFQR